MALQEVQLRGGGADLPAEVLDVCIAAEERARQFIDQRALEARIAEFQASNVRSVSPESEPCMWAWAARRSQRAGGGS